MGNSQRNGRSIAIWSESQSQATNGQLHVHFNYWHLGSHRSKSKESRDFFDIGLRCVADACPSSLLIYIPLTVKADTLEDLGPLFSDKELAAGIFNESLSVTQEPQSSHIMLSRNGQRFARVFVFPAQKHAIASSHLTATDYANGTLIQVTSVALTEGRTGLGPTDALYFRIRVRLPAENPFLRTIEPADNFLLSSFEDTQFLDFRLNEVRNLPDTVAARMWNGSAPDHPGALPISQVHFLVVVGEAASVAGGGESDKQRLLESHLWERYTKDSAGGQNPLCDDMVVHHWTKKSSGGGKDIGAFSAFMKLRVRRSGRSLIARYLAVVAVIGCIGSLLGSVVWAGLDKLFSATLTPPLTAEAVAKTCSQSIAQVCGKDNVKWGRRTGGKTVPASGEDQ